MRLKTLRKLYSRVLGIGVFLTPLLYCPDSPHASLVVTKYYDHMGAMCVLISQRGNIITAALQDPQLEQQSTALFDFSQLLPSWVMKTADKLTTHHLHACMVQTRKLKGK